MCRFWIRRAARFLLTNYDMLDLEGVFLARRVPNMKLLIRRDWNSAVQMRGTSPALRLPKKALLGM